MRFKLWTPNVHDLQGPKFRQAVLSLISCQRHYCSPVSMLPDECIYYIMNMCRWDDFGDGPTQLRERRRTRRQREQEAARLQREHDEAIAAAQQETDAMEQDAVADANEVGDASAGGQEEDRTSGSGCCLRRVASTSSNDQDEEFHDVAESEQSDDSDSDDEMEDNEEVDDENDDDEDVSFSDDEESEDSDGEEDDDDDDDTDESDWERAHGYRADNRVFRFRIVDSDDEDAAAANEETIVDARPAFFRRNLIRIHVLRAIAAGDNARRGDDDVDMET